MQRFLADIFTNPLGCILCIIGAIILMKILKVGKGVFKFCFFVFIAWLILFGFGGK